MVLIPLESFIVPLRQTVEALDASITWNPETKGVSMENGFAFIGLTVGSTVVELNGIKQSIDVPAKMVNGSVFVPLRFISQAFDATVTWDQATKTIAINNEIE